MFRDKRHPFDPRRRESGLRGAEKTGMDGEATKAHLFLDKWATHTSPPKEGECDHDKQKDQPNKGTDRVKGRPEPWRKMPSDRLLPGQETPKPMLLHSLHLLV